jgi:Uma2 family endonuclease
MAQTETALLTVAEFDKIADPPGGHNELHHGECVFVPAPMMEHTRIQRELVLLLTRYCQGYCATTEVPFRPFPEHELWVADVAMVTEARWRATPKRAWLSGSPELVAEVLSPSNTVQEISDKKWTCFHGGCQEFWVLDPKRNSIEVSTPDGQSRTYATGDEIPLDRFASGKLIVADVFAE